MKKYSLYILFIILGVLLGKFAFNDKPKESNHHENVNPKNTNWTCSMHPQINQPDKGDCPICGMDLIPATSEEGSLSTDQFKMSDNAIALANIQTMMIGESMQNSNNNLTLSGKLVSNENTKSVQTVHIAGRIEKLYVKSKGEKVKKGQLIASIYSPELATAQQELLIASKFKNEQPEVYRAVRGKMKTWKISKAQINSIERTGKIQELVNIYAENSGIVKNIMADQGDYLAKGQGLFKLFNLNSIWAELEVYENQIAKLKIGQKVTIKVSAFPEKKFNAKVIFIHPELNDATRTLRVRAQLNNPNELLKPNMFVEGFIAIKKDEKSILSVPKTAVLWTGKRSIVYVKPNKKESIFELREIEIGSSTGDNYPVLSGLEAGETIVINGTFTVDATAQLQSKRSMMNLKKASKAKEPMLEEKIPISSALEKDLQNIFAIYLKLKDSFISSDFEAIKSNSKILYSESLKIKNPEIKELISKAKKLVEAKDLKAQRKQFKFLSTFLIRYLKNFKSPSKTYYIQHCPMADNDNGADWISLDSAIKNPYFGKMMLKCGETKQTIESK